MGIVVRYNDMVNNDLEYGENGDVYVYNDMYDVDYDILYDCDWIYQY